MAPPSYYEKYVPLKKCELDPLEMASKNIYLKGRLYYDNVEENPDYDYTWAFVRIDDVA